MLDDERYKLGNTNMTDEMKEFILDQINSLRSLVATGKQPQFESASNMRLVVRVFF